METALGKGPWLSLDQQLLLTGAVLCLLNQGIAWGQEPSSQGEIEFQLRHTVRVLRKGRTLILIHELVDSSGKAHDVRAITQAAPRFAVYQGDKKLATSKFEFG